MTKLALLWHMHQPYYEDLVTREHMLPWVRLHALKDYWGMVALLEEFPGVRVTFNLVPSLLVQIEAFAADRAQDRHLSVGLMRADELRTDERRFLVENGFHAPFERMIRPYPRYAELHARRSASDLFTVDDLRDLQVLHKLVWIDPDRVRTDARLRALVEKGRGYTEEDKQALRRAELDILRAVIPAYRRAANSGEVELSTSPFYHPILPLLCDTDVHLRAQPHSGLPRQLFAREDDAREQLARALDYHTRLFGARPAGVWPSEGSVSDAVVRLLNEQRVTWTATDEEILARSLGRGLTAGDLYRPYALGGGVQALFRDHQLSDLIGFAYQSWDAAAAADDFVARVRDAGRRFAASSSGEDAVVTVILDGENAWEHYAGGGRPFLRALYGKLQAARDISTVTMREAAEAAARPLPSIFPGSWINGDFYIWAGHADDQRAWRQLADARAAFDVSRPAARPEALERAFEELLIAEGSDWFWWYGDDHSSDHDPEFDELFRRHLRNVYRALDVPVPDELYRTNITTVPPAAGAVSIGVLSSPSIDGRSRDFTQWAAAVDVPLGSGGGTMQRVAGQLVRSLRVAADRHYLYLRLDGSDLARRVRAAEVQIGLLQDRPRAGRVEPNRIGDGYQEGPRYDVDDVVTMAVPFGSLGATPGDVVSLSVLVTDPGGNVVEQHPARQPFSVRVPSEEHEATYWVV